MPVRFFAFIGLACAASAQDERRVTSPDGQINFRLFVATQDDSNLSRIAYDVFFRGKPLLATSFLGLDIQDQEPLLGENDGLTSSSAAKGANYNSLTAKYMQNGSLGRLIDVEVRAYDDGVAFRYVIPPSTPLIELLIAEEATEFHFAGGIGTGAVFQVPAGWAAVTESISEVFPPMHLVRADQSTMLTRLARPFKGTTPLTCPWRIISIGADRERALRGERLLLLGLPRR